MARSQKPRRGAPASLARARMKKPPRVAWYGLVAAIGAGVLLLVLTVMLVGSYLAPVFGRGWPWFGATLLLALGIPFAIGLWLVRPLEGFRRAAWFAGVCVIVPSLAVVGLSAGTPRHTASQLRKHGHWPMEQVFGPPTRSSTTRFGETLATTWANLLHHKKAKRKKARAKPAVPSGKGRVKPRKPARAIFYSGVRRARRRPRPDARAQGPQSRIRFVRRGREIMIPVRLSLRRRVKKLAMMLDTGASISTIDRVAAKRLGVRLPANPLTVELQTAAGPRNFPVAVLDRVRLGQATLRHVTVAICDPCAQPGLHGLIGLNFTRHFVTTIDHKKRRLLLRRQAGPPNRISDVEPFLHLLDVRGESTGGQFTVTGKVHNRGPRTVRTLALEAVLLDTHDKTHGRLQGKVDRLEPRQTRLFRLSGKSFGALVKYRLELTSARW
jgi:Aspartyl protease